MKSALLTSMFILVCFFSTAKADNITIQPGSQVTVGNSTIRCEGTSDIRHCVCEYVGNNTYVLSLERVQPNNSVVKIQLELDNSRENCMASLALSAACK